MEYVGSKAMSDRRRPAKTRVYMWKVTGTKDEQSIGAHPPFGLRGENPANDLLWDAWNAHLLAKWRAEILPAVFEKHGIEEPFAKAKYSRKAGCSCGCSPGFILDRDYGFDIHVDYDPSKEVQS